jgi:hypothetical protein
MRYLKVKETDVKETDVKETDVKETDGFLILDTLTPSFVYPFFPYGIKHGI